MGVGRPFSATAAGATIVLLVATAAAAGTVDRVRVGVSGRNATEGLSPALFVDVPVVADYVQAKFDGEQGDWQGPDYTATQKPGTGRTDLSFRSIFDNHIGSLDAMAKKALVHGTWTLSQKTAVKVPRVLGGRLVGMIGGELALYEEPITGAARWESVLALPLCHGVFGAVDFYADAPPQDTSGTAGQYLVDTTPAKEWNHDHALAAAQGVKLEGPLPGGHLMAHAAGHKIVGKVSDCGGPLGNAPVVLQRNEGSRTTLLGRALTTADGTFRLATSRAGSYRVSVALGPFRTTASVTVR